MPDGRTLRWTQILTLTTPDGGIDLLVDPDGSPGYSALRRRASEVDIDGIKVRVASIDDLIAMKRAVAGRRTWLTSNRWKRPVGAYAASQNNNDRLRCVSP